MKPTLLDTDILSAFFRGNPIVIKHAARYLQEFECLNLSIISYYEILNGLLYKDAHNQLKRFTDFIVLNKVMPLTLSATRRAAEIYADLRKKGTPIGHTDSLIAGIAIANNLQLATNNTDHFSRIHSIELVNWMQ